MRLSWRQYGKQPFDRQWLQRGDDIKMGLGDRLLRSAENSKIRPFCFKLERSPNYISRQETGWLLNVSYNLFFQFAYEKFRTASCTRCEGFPERGKAGGTAGACHYSSTHPHILLRLKKECSYSSPPPSRPVI